MYIIEVQGQKTCHSFAFFFKKIRKMVFQNSTLCSLADSSEIFLPAAFLYVLLCDHDIITSSLRPVDFWLFFSCSAYICKHWTTLHILHRTAYCYVMKWNNSTISYKYDLIHNTNYKLPCTCTCLTKIYVSRIGILVT